MLSDGYMESLETGEWVGWEREEVGSAAGAPAMVQWGSVDAPWSGATGRLAAKWDAELFSRRCELESCEVVFEAASAAAKYCSAAHKMKDSRLRRKK